ncbi:MAG: cytochrome b N-terminal domain-containing protein [Acidobacteriaceae bacterium]
MRGINDLKKVYDWLEMRVGFEKPVKEAALHPVPRNTASWWYVFGSAAFTLLMLQVFTGILLALVYVPSAGQAWQSLNFLNHNLTLGWYIRAVHGWGSNFMVAIVLIHMAQVFLFGAYKYPRELTWMVGVLLLLLTLGMAFTGQVMRFDQDAYWGLGIGAMITSRVPFIGGQLVHLLLGGPIIGGATLSHFFALHVFIIPAALLGLAGLHVWMVLRLGINEWPMPGRAVKRETYMEEYHKLTHEDGVPFVPVALWKDIVFSSGIILAVLVCAAIFGPQGPTGMPNPTYIHTDPKPDFFFLWIYTTLAFLPPWTETPLLIIGPPIIILALLGFPLLASEGEKSWYRRPVAVLVVLLMAVGWGALTDLGTYTPWSPHMDAWSEDTIAPQQVKAMSPLERQGAVVFQDKQCRNCHEVDGHGGMRGPALDDIATTMTYDQLIRQVLQGGGNMPAYGKNLSPAEVDAVVAYLETLHKPGQKPAVDEANQWTGQAVKVSPAPPVPPVGQAANSMTEQQLQAETQSSAPMKAPAKASVTAEPQTKGQHTVAMKMAPGA